MSNILAIESSGLTASVAVMSNGRLAAEYTVNNKKTHSQTLLPMINEVMKALELEPGELNCIAISCGPGSFTGLRIGSATAKGLGLALDKPIAEVSTLKGLAYNLCGNEGCVICPIMDARRQEVYTGAYEFVRTGIGENYEIRENSKKDSVSDFEMKTLITERAVPLTEMLSELEKLGKKVIFNGDAVPVYKDIIAEKFSLEYSFAPETLLLQRAASIAALGEKIFLNGEAKDADVHTPVYLRKSQAERELEEGRT
ncbi:MAG: tRNA (adenosine(37)-N6)-threonylcarbamoyltransferase complex dimerization subunit type 1 TsaB [Lachnospiraceae bacterium]|nr:tRNA (adenosine(37)-N6)-threonylcarbamoyltransferase complex dimerization subunit type 1 TsaB [Lachnospiraceae bacterium]